MPTQDNRHNIIQLSDDSYLSNVLPEGEPLLTKALPNKKWGEGDRWNDPSNFVTPSKARERVETKKNYGFALGHGKDDWKLVAFDVEQKGVLPEAAQALIDEHALLIWNSVHSGQNRLVKVSKKAYKMLEAPSTAHNHLSDGANDDIELQTSGHCIGPDSEIAHEHCRDTKEDCPSTGRDTYELVVAKPFAPVVTEDTAEQILEALEIDSQASREKQCAGSGENITQVPTYNQTDVSAAEAHLKTLQANHGSCFHCLSDRLNGGTGNKDGLRFECELIDRSATDFVTVSDLYGVMRSIGNEGEQRARELAYAYYTHRCDGNKYMKSSKGRLRKWLSIGQKYRQNVLGYATESFDRGQFQRWLNQRNNHTDVPWAGPMDGHYADTTRNITWFSLYLLTGCLLVDADSLESAAIDMFNLDLGGKAVVGALDAMQDGLSPHPHFKDEVPPNCSTSHLRYPTKRDVAELAKALDEGRGNEMKTYKDVLGVMKRDGYVNMAECPARPNGERYVYYPLGLSAPDDAL